MVHGRRYMREGTEYIVARPVNTERNIPTYLVSRKLSRREGERAGFESDAGHPLTTEECSLQFRVM